MSVSRAAGKGGAREVSASVARARRREPCVVGARTVEFSGRVVAAVRRKIFAALRDGP